MMRRFRHAFRRAAWPLVAGREIRVSATSMVVRVSTGITLLAVLGGIIAVHFLTNRVTTYRVGAVSADASAIVQTVAGRHGTIVIREQEFSDRQSAEAAVRSGRIDAALVPPGDGSGWLVVAEHTPSATLVAYLTQAVQRGVLQDAAVRAGLAPNALIAASRVTPIALVPQRQDQAADRVIAAAFGVLFFVSCQLFGTAMSTGAAEEKESRVVEVLLAAIPARALLAGKIVGNVAVAFAQMTLYAAAAAAAAAAVGGIPHLDAILRSGGWFLLFYLVGFTTVAFLFAGLGALASRIPDVPAATMPIQLLVIATYIFAVIGKGAAVTVASFLPVLCTVAMPQRIFAGHVPGWQVGLALLAAVLFSGLALTLASRIYQVAALHSGVRLRLLSTLRSASRRPAPASAGS